MARPRKPTHLKVVSGTDRPHRHRNEPQPVRGVPEPPAELSPRAQEMWPYVARILDDMGVLTTADGAAVSAACEAWADLQEAREAVRSRGALTYETTSGEGSTMYRAYPEVAMVSDADRRLRIWLGALGMTPADRSKVSAAPKQAENPFAALG